MGARTEEENVGGAKRWLHLQRALSLISLDRGGDDGGEAVGIDDDDDQLAHTVLLALADDFGTQECVMFLTGDEARPPPSPSYAPPP